jgi:hypothetical protein
MRYIQPIGGAANDPYVNENPGTGTEGSPVDARAIEHPQREILAAIVSAGLVPAEGDLTQLADAIAIIAAAAAPSMANVAYKNLVQLFTKAQGSAPVVLADAAPVAVDLDLSNYFTLAPTVSRTLANPTHVQEGRAHAIYIKQPAGGNCGLIYGSNYLYENNEPPSNTTTPNAVDMAILIGLPNDKVFVHMKHNIF